MKAPSLSVSETASLQVRAGRHTYTYLTDRHATGPRHGRKQQLPSPVELRIEVPAPSASDSARTVTCLVLVVPLSPCRKERKNSLTTESELCSTIAASRGVSVRDERED